MLKLYHKNCGYSLRGLFIFLCSFFFIQLAAQEDHATHVERAPDGCTVVVTIQLGVDGTAADVTTVTNAVEGCLEIDTCFIPCADPSTRKCPVRVVVTVSHWDSLSVADQAKYHRINMVADDGTASSATRRNPNGARGTATFKRGQSAAVYCHEVMHLCGLRDQYCGINTYAAPGDPPAPRWREPVCPDPPGPNPCNCPPPPENLDSLGSNMRCTKPCNGFDNDIMSDLGTLDCSHILQIVSLAGLNSCPENPCCILPYTVDSEGNVSWGDEEVDNHPINDFIPPNGGSIRFYWTRGRYTQGQPGEPHPDYQIFEETNNGSQHVTRRFRRPRNDTTITDWTQIIITSNGSSHVSGNNIHHGSPWEFQPLANLPIAYWRIPDLAPTNGDPGHTIYTAVNLAVYFDSNPVGFLNGNWQHGQVLNDLDIEIIDGQIEGLEGIYWATTDFTFDPDSPYGFVPIGGESALLNSNEFQDQFGDIVILAAHESDISQEPIPTLGEWGIILFTLLLLAFGVYQLKVHQLKATGNTPNPAFSILFRSAIMRKILMLFPILFIAGFILIMIIWQHLTIGDTLGLALGSIIIAYVILMVKEPGLFFDKNLTNS